MVLKKGMICWTSAFVKIVSGCFSESEICCSTAALIAATQLLLNQSSTGLDYARFIEHAFNF